MHWGLTGDTEITSEFQDVDLFLRDFPVLNIYVFISDLSLVLLTVTVVTTLCSFVTA